MNVLDFKKDVGLWHGILTVSHASEKKNYVNIRFHIQGVNMSLPVSLECHEHDACNQHPILPDEGQPSVLDPKSVSVQRSVSQCLH